MSWTLYELAQDLRGIMAAHEAFLDEEGEPDDEDRQAWADTIEAAYGDLAVKMDACAVMVTTWDAQAKAFSEEMARLSAKRATTRRSIEHLKAYMMEALRIAKQTKVRGKRFMVGVQANTPSVVCAPELLPDRFVEIEIERKPDKVALRKALLMGEEIEGAKLERGKSLRIR